MEIIVNNGAVDNRQMMKEVSKRGAIDILSSMTSSEEKKSTDSWFRKRVDWSEAGKNARKYRKNLEKVSPETLPAHVKDRMWCRAKQLKDEFMHGMLSRDELHPVRGFKENGVMKYVCDEEKLRTLNVIERERAWQKRNEGKVREFKNLMRHLCPDDPRAADIERFRPRRKSLI